MHSAASLEPRAKAQLQGSVCFPRAPENSIIRAITQEFCAAVLSQKALTATGDTLITTSGSDRGLSWSD